MLYVILILTADILITLGNLLATGAWAAWLHVACKVVVATVAVIAVDGITAFVVRRFPGKWFRPGLAFYDVSSKERKFYQHLGIKKWKNRVPELGMFTGFHKDHLQDAKDVSYLERFLLESNYGFVIHLVNAMFGFFILCLPYCGAAQYALPVALVNFVLSLMPAAILRYNTPGLFRLYQRAKGNRKVAS